MLNFLLEYGYYGLFIASFLSSTVLPFSSEAVLTGCILAGMSPIKCLIYATIGNFLGGVTTYFIGFLGKIEWAEKYLGIKQEKIEKAKVYIAKYGAFMAFFSFLPIVGDIIPLTLGFMRSSVWKVLFGMFLGKLFRYLIIIYIVGVI